MSATELLTQIAAWTPDQLRAFITAHHPEDYYLLDVRQLQAYGTQHLPGATWIPAEKLPEKLETLDSGKTVVVYCDLGGLSRSAAELLVTAGFKDVHYLEGGIRAWEQGVSTGLPQHSTISLMEAESPEIQVLLAWQMEEAARIYYDSIAKSIDNSAVAALFAELSNAENHHKMTLKALWEALTGRPAGEEFPGESTAVEKIMEGGLKLEDALRWAEKSSHADIVDYALAMELNAYDQYLYLQRNATDPNSQRLFEVMADEERHHLRSLGELLGKLQQAA